MEIAINNTSRSFFYVSIRRDFVFKRSASETKENFSKKITSK